MSHPTRISLNSILVGDELGQIKLVQFNPALEYEKFISESRLSPTRIRPESTSVRRPFEGTHFSSDQSNDAFHRERRTSDSRFLSTSKHRIVRVLDDCIHKEPAVSKTIKTIRPIERIHESGLDTSDRPNHLFMLSNRVGQVFVCNTDAIRKRLRCCEDLEVKLDSSLSYDDELHDGSDYLAPMLMPIYYNRNNSVPVSGAQPINQTNMIIIYENGDIQHVGIGQDTIQSSLKINRKAIKLLGLGYDNNSRAIHWRIDGSSGLCYIETDGASIPLTRAYPWSGKLVSQPSHKLSKKLDEISQSKLYKAPCVESHLCNEQDNLVPTQVLNMVASRAAQRRANSSRSDRRASTTSLSLIYRKLAHRDLLGSSFSGSRSCEDYSVNCFKISGNRLAVGGQLYALRVYDISTQKPIFNCKSGPSEKPVKSTHGSKAFLVGDIDWLGGSKTNRRPPDLIATCTGVDSFVLVYDLRSSKPAFQIDLSQEAQNRWLPYDDYPRGCVFTSICASGAPYSTAAPSQQLALGSTNGRLHVIDLRFVVKSYRTLGRLSGFCGGAIRDIRFVSESFETSKMISCASDRFVRVHKIQTSFTSVISQKLSSKVFLGTRPTCVQPVCDEITKSYLASAHSESQSQISIIDPDSWSLL